MAMDFPSLSASVVGGGVGGRLSLNALQGSPHFNMVAAADLRPEIQNSLERDFPGLRAFASHEEMRHRRRTGRTQIELRNAGCGTRNTQSQSLESPSIVLIKICSFLLP
jgi:hypothetical protein